MTRLTPSTKAIILELHVNGTWDTVELVEQIAGVLHIDVGEQETTEYVQLMNLRTINKENLNAH